MLLKMSGSLHHLHSLTKLRNPFDVEVNRHYRTTFPPRRHCEPAVIVHFQPSFRDKCIFTVPVRETDLRDTCCEAPSRVDHRTPSSLRENPGSDTVPAVSTQGRMRCCGSLNYTNEY